MTNKYRILNKRQKAKAKSFGLGIEEVATDELLSLDNVRATQNTHIIKEWVPCTDGFQELVRKECAAAMFTLLANLSVDVDSKGMRLTVMPEFEPIFEISWKELLDWGGLFESPTCGSDQAFAWELYDHHIDEMLEGIHEGRKKRPKKYASKEIPQNQLIQELRSLLERASGNLIDPAREQGPESNVAKLLKKIEVALKRPTKTALRP
jgi:hypothetical protein